MEADSQRGRIGLIAKISPMAELVKIVYDYTDSQVAFIGMMITVEMGMTPSANGRLSCKKTAG